MNKPTKKEKVVFVIALAFMLVMLIMAGQRVLTERLSDVTTKNADIRTDNKAVACKSDLIIPSDSPFARPEQLKSVSESAPAELPVPLKVDETNVPPVFDEISVRKDTPATLLVVATIGKNTAIITDGKAAETVWSGKSSGWGRIGAIVTEGVYVDDVLIKTKYAASVPGGMKSKDTSAGADQKGEYRWPDDGGKFGLGGAD